MSLATQGFNFQGALTWGWGGITICLLKAPWWSILHLLKRLEMWHPLSFVVRSLWITWWEGKYT